MVVKFTLFNKVIYKKKRYSPIANVVATWSAGLMITFHIIALHVLS